MGLGTKGPCVDKGTLKLIKKGQMLERDTFSNLTLHGLQTPQVDGQ